MKITGLKKRVNDVYWEYGFKNQHPIQIYFGGASSGKSYDIGGTRTVIDTLRGRNYLVFRKVASTIHDSIWSEITSKISDFKMNDFFEKSLGRRTITSINGNQIIFKGLDDIEKIKSIRALNGPITDILIEEATEMSYNDYKQLIKRLRGISKFTKRITFLFNPILQTHWIYKEFFEGLWQDDKRYVENDKVSILKTTYKDNKFLTQEDIYNLENEKDPYYYNVYTLGNWGVLGSVVFKNWRTEEFDKEQFENYTHGVDWGFSNDPFAYVRVAVDHSRKKIYICDEIYQAGLLNYQSAPMVNKHANHEVVWCDSAEPKSIEEYKTLGVRAKPVKKGQGSIESGIKFLKQFEIIIHPSCVNTTREFSTYRYKEDKDGNVLPSVVDKDNHSIDAIRYSIENEIIQKPLARDLL